MYLAVLIPLENWNYLKELNLVRGLGPFLLADPDTVAQAWKKNVQLCDVIFRFAWVTLGATDSV